MNGITKTYRTNVWDAFAKDTNFRFVDNLSKLCKTLMYKTKFTHLILIPIPLSSPKF
jgi:hypothetical protein